MGVGVWDVGVLLFSDLAVTQLVRTSSSNPLHKTSEVMSYPIKVLKDVRTSGMDFKFNTIIGTIFSPTNFAIVSLLRIGYR